MIGSSPAKGWWDDAKSLASDTYDSAKQSYDDMDIKGTVNKGLDYAQTGLTAAGMVPGVGNAVDLLNTGVSGARAAHAKLTGDSEAAKGYMGDMALNAASAIPGAGLAVGATKLAKTAAKGAKTLKAANKTEDALAVVKKGQKIKKKVTKVSKVTDATTGATQLATAEKQEKPKQEKPKQENKKLAVKTEPKKVKIKKPKKKKNEKPTTKGSESKA
jgi:outer membrane biosynthesis protein TonB